MSLYPKADLGTAGEVSAATCSEEEAADLVQSILEIATQVIQMIQSICLRFNVDCAAHSTM
jgi:hypothetical protein